MSLSYKESAPDSLVEKREDGSKTADRLSVLLSVHTDFSSVEAIWRQFEKTADCFAFQTFDFLETWFEHIGSRDEVELQIVVAWTFDAVPIMILPLGIEKTRFAHKLTWLGSDVNDYNAPLLASNFAERVVPGEFPALWNKVLSSLPDHDLVELLYQPAMVEGQANPFMELSSQLNASGAHMTELGADFEAYYAGKRNAKARSHLRNRRKKLEEIGETVYVLPETDEGIAASVGRLVQLKTVSLNAMGARNFLTQPGYEQFYKSLAIKSGKGGPVHVSHLEVGGKYIAGIWGLVHRRRFYYLLASYDGLGYGRYKPGVQTLVETMRWAAGQGIKTFDFTVGDESYKSKWCEVHIDLHDHLSAKTLRGSLVLLKTRVFLALKRKIKQTPFLWSMFTRLRTRFLAT